MLEFISTHIMELGWTCIVGILAMLYKTIQKNFKKVLAVKSKSEKRGEENPENRERNPTAR